MTSLLAVVDEIDDQAGLTSKAIETCECSGVDIETLDDRARPIWLRRLKTLNELILDWSAAKAHQSGAMMKAVNATM